MQVSLPGLYPSSKSFFGMGELKVRLYPLSQPERSVVIMAGWKEYAGFGLVGWVGGFQENPFQTKLTFFPNSPPGALISRAEPAVE